MSCFISFSESAAKIQAGCLRVTFSKTRNHNGLWLGLQPLSQSLDKISWPSGSNSFRAKNGCADIKPNTQAVVLFEENNSGRAIVRCGHYRLKMDQFF